METAVLFGQLHVKTLEGANEAFEYIVSGDSDEKMESLVLMVEAEILGDAIWDVADSCGEAFREGYGAVDAARGDLNAATLKVFREYEANGTVSSSSLQVYEDTVERMRSAFDGFGASYSASLPTSGLSDDAVAAVSLLAMQEELTEAVGESLEYVALGNLAEKEEYAAGMSRFMAEAEGFNSTPYLYAGENADILNQYQALMAAVADYQSAADTLFAGYEAEKKVSPEAFEAYEAAVDAMRSAFDSLTASVIAKL